MHYSNDIDIVLKSELTNLINMVRKKELAFIPGVVEKYYEVYKNLKLED